MKKEILFIIPGLEVGGAEKSLINLLNQFDYSKYNVDLFLLNKSGLFMDFVPKEVNIIDQPQNLKIFNNNIFKSIEEFVFNRKFNLAYCRLMFCIKNKVIKNKVKAEQYSWKYIRSAIGILDKKYDLAIGYLEKTSNYICVDCVQANKKIGWIHTDYNKLKADKKYDENFFQKLDHIITVSEECSEVLKDNFEKQKHKVMVIKNIISEKSIKKMSLEKIDINRKKDEIIIVSVGRLSYEKGFDIAIIACKILKEKGLNIKWYLIGDGGERAQLENLIKSNGLIDNFILIGADPNPYKYLLQADIYVQPSRFEGKSIAIDEAKILNKPIVVTNFSTVNDQITNKFDGIIAEMNEFSLATEIEKLIKDRKLKNIIIRNLSNMALGTENEINKVYEIIQK